MHASIYIEREIHVYIDRYFLSIRSFFLYLMYSRKKKMKTSSFFFLLLYIRQGRVFLWDLAWRCYCRRRRRHHRRRYDDVYVYIFSFQLLLLPLPWLWCCVYRYATLCRCRSLSSFLRVFFFDSIDARNGECSMLSLFLLFALLQSTLVAYSYVFLTLHFCVLFRCMPSVFFEVTWKNKSSHHLYTGKRDSLVFFSDTDWTLIRLTDWLRRKRKGKRYSDIFHIELGEKGACATLTDHNQSIWCN